MLSTTITPCGFGWVHTLHVPFFTSGGIKIMANLTADDLTLGMHLPDGLDLGFEVDEDGEVLTVFDLDSGELIDIYTIH